MTGYNWATRMFRRRLARITAIRDNDISTGAFYDAYLVFEPMERVARTIPRREPVHHLHQKARRIIMQMSREAYIDEVLRDYWKDAL